MRYWFFDLDGTLADTDRDIREAWKATLRDLDLPCPDFEEKFVSGPPIDDMARTLFPDLFTPALADAIRTGFARHYDTDGHPNTREYPGVLAVVRELRARGDHVAIVTNKRYAGMTAMARKFGWYGIFHALHSGDMDIALGRPDAVKLPKTKLLTRVIADLDAPADACTMVGDTRSDFEAAAHCGIASIAVTWGYGKPAELALATRQVATPDELLAIARNPAQ